MAEDGPSLPSAPPDAERLQALDDQVWGALLVHLRRAVAGVADTEPDVRVRRLASVPASRLMSGRSRRDAARAIAGGGPLWVDLRRRITRDPALTARLAGALQAVPEAGADGEAPAAAPGPPDAGAELDRLRERLRRTRDQRDDARRRADGEAARADREAAARTELEATVQALRDRVERLEQDVARAAEDRAAALDRERRRGQAAVAEVSERLRALRRDVDDQARRDRAAAQARATQAAQAAAAPTEPRRAPRLVPGRPSRLPGEVRADTTEAADVLLHDGRVVLVDGYNVTRTHRADLDLEGQRRWLVNLVAGAVASRRIDGHVVFDSHASRGPGSSRRDRGVLVSFTPEGITADDDLVFAVEARDPAEPLVVVTDDRELRDRLAPYRVDLLSTRTFLGAIG